MNPETIDASAGAQAPSDETPIPARRLRGKDLLGIAELSAEEITLVLDTAVAMKEISSRPIKKVPALRGKTVVNLFFEPSTRTRTSFEIAEKRLSADTLNIAASTSSVVKGETLADTSFIASAVSRIRVISDGVRSAIPRRSFPRRRVAFSIMLALLQPGPG